MAFILPLGPSPVKDGSLCTLVARLGQESALLMLVLTFD